MGILRTDRVAGLGGANAIKGSAHFHGGGDCGGLETEASSDFQFGSSNFTIEVWANFSGFDSSGFETIVKSGNTNPSDSMFQFDYKSSESKLRIIPYVSNSSVVKQVSFTPEFDRWYHLAAVRDGNNLKIFIDGTQTGGDLSFSDTIDSETTGLSIGKRAMSDENNGFERNFNGYLSNLRIVNGTAIYTADFTPPTNELEKTSDTVLLALQSPGNLFQEATGKKLYVTADRLNQQSVTASRKTPNSPVGFSTTTDVGTQFGTTFDGVTTFDSQAYMVPPGGNTRERNRGLGVISGGRNRSTMEFINIQSQGNSQQFGDSVTGDGIEGFAVGSSTRGLFSGPQSPLSNVIEFITFASQSNGTDFGDTTSARRSGAGAGNETRGLFAGGIVEASSPYGGTNITDFVTIATAGNATDFGDLNTANEQSAPNADTTRVVIAGGTINGGNSVNNIDFFTIATTGNATDFGDMTTAHGAGAGGASSSTRGLIAGGVSPDKLNTIQFITIQTTGNSSEYGDLTSARGYTSGMSNSIRGVFAGGYEPTQVNTIDFVNIATTSNAIDFGDLSLGVNFVTQATSDSHGGL